MHHRFAPIAATLLGLASLTAHAQTLEVRVDGVRNATGELRVGLYRDTATFRKEAQAFRIATTPAQAGTQTLQFTDVPPGRYAVMAYHDENANGKMDLRLGMFPVEGYALSNNPKVMGPPRFDDSAFDVPEQGTQITLGLSY